MSLFNVGDLVSWKGKDDYGIILNKRPSIIGEFDYLFVRFFAANSQDACWYSSKDFVLMSGVEKQNQAI